MINKAAKKFQTLFNSTLASALILSAGVSYADDTEIFFGGPAIDEGIRPNVLFILDNSGSMNWRLDSNNSASANQTSRLQVLKSSFADIMANTDDINVGVMVLNSRSNYDNSRYVYPVEYIDKELGENIDLVASTPEILQSSDDAVQAIYPLGTAVISDPALVMGVIDATHQLPGTVESELTTSGSFFLKKVTAGKLTTEYACRFSPANRSSNAVCDNKPLEDLNLKKNAGNVGLFYFGGLNIAAGKTISSAYIEITPTNTPSSSKRSLYINIQMQNDKNPAALNDSTTLGDRSYQAAKDTQVSGWTSGNRIAVDVTSLITTLKSTAPATNPIQGVFARLSNTTTLNSNASQDYNFCVENCSDGNRPKLIINYTEDGLVPEKRMGALRFQNVGIPQGATVTSAKLSFVPAATNADPVTFEVRAEKSDDAATFVAGSNLLSRSKTTALTTWSPEGWVNQATPEPIEGPDVTAQVQEIVSTSGWCGNNAMAFYLTPTVGTGTRSAKSFDGAGGLQPTLTISYTGGKNGCYNSIIDARITASANDGHQAQDGVVNLGATTLPLTKAQIGARFEKLPIARNAEVMSAQVVITPAETVTNPSLNLNINFQNSATGAVLSATRNNFTNNRNSRTASSTCNINNTTGWDANQPVICDISSQSSALTNIFANASWSNGNALNMFITPASTSSLLARSFESNPGQSIRLRLKIRNGGLITTVRSQVNSLVQAMVAGDGTPIVPTYWDAVKYFRNSVSGRPSPIDSACQANHIVLLTDGQASGYDNSVMNNIGALTGKCTGDSTDNDEKCARTLAKWISENDQSSIAGDNYITTHTVGFALDASGSTTSANVKKFLKDIAENGGGSFSTAENASELSDAFNRIIQEVLATDTSFVSASAPVNSFERSDNKDELYFSLFRPQETNRWPGNLKRYRYALYDNDGKFNPFIADANNLPAVDPLTGQFADSAKSFWSTAADGNNTASGGAASKLPASGSRKVLTYIGNTPSGSPTLQALDTSNTNITSAILGASTDVERNELINYIRGLDPTTNTQRRALGDPIHSSPRLATYSCNSVVNGACAEADQTAFIGTNEGFLHAINTSTGVEQFAFMPQELLGNVKLLKDNARSSSLVPRRYGLDSPVVIWANDVDGDGKILNNPSDTSPQAGEFVYAYVTMGRGGRNIYALDVTNRAAPKLMWHIKGGETYGFEQLGQTWSVPVRTRIKIGNDTDPTDVLIFAGGYDPEQDNAKQLHADNMGNAIYIVNAKTGALIWSASNQGDHTLTLPKMKYSMPGNVRVIDLNINSNGNLEVDKEQLADQFFIGDMGGQVWRFFINNGTTGALVTPAGSGWSESQSGDGIFASAIPDNYDNLDAVGKLKNLRRFYNEPDAALLNRDGKVTLSINIGTGYRGHPLEMGTEDIFYSFRTPFLGAGGEGTITANNMFDTTTQLYSNITDSTTSDAAKAKLNPTTQVKKGGWYIKMPNPGEKVLTRSLTTGQDSVVFFNTYTPGNATASNSCKAAFGTSRGYAVDLFDAAPYTKWYSGTPTYQDRSINLMSSGIPPQPEQICIGDTCAIIVDKNRIETVDMPAPGKMYWIDETELN